MTLLFCSLSVFFAIQDGSDFTDADLSLANVEMAQFARASLKNTVMREAYVSGSTLFEGVKGKLADISSSF